MVRPKSICVFCGASAGANPAFGAAASELGTMLGEVGIELVFGGGHVGMMGLVADAALAAGGRVVGVIPEHLMARELGHGGVNEMHVVDSMHSRKEMMFTLADAFVVLPGGVGTLDETFEIITWKQLGLHDKPIAILDIAGYWAKLREMIAQIIDAGFAGPATARLFTVVDSVGEILPALDTEPPPAIATDPSRL